MNRFLKVIAVLAVALSAATFSAKAQSLPSLFYGVTVGANVSNYSLTDTEGLDLSKGRAGYQAGVLVGINILTPLDITAEVLWVHNSMSFNKTVFGNSRISGNSVELPILAELKILGPLRVKAGPSFQLYNNTKAHFGDGYENLESVKSSLGYVLGVGLNLSKFTFDVRYNGQFEKDLKFSLENIPTMLGNASSNFDINAGSFSAAVGYRF